MRLPGVLHTNVGHSKFGYRTLKKFIRSDISAFVQDITRFAAGSCGE